MLLEKEGLMAESTILHRLFSLAGKAALVTGGSGGIGRTLAVALAEAGAAVAVHGRKSEEIDKTCELVKAAGVQAVALEADVADTAACRRLIADAHRQLGRLDILVNCAATNRRKRIAEVTDEDYDSIMDVNLRSVFVLSQAAHPIMREQGGGKIIHIGSINIYYGLDTVSVYGASKGGVGQLTKVMAVEWAPDNIQVNCLVPGFMYTPLSQSLWDDPEKSRWFRSRIPMRRPGLPEDLVGMTVMLASPASDYVTGQNFIVDGGFMAGGSWHRDELV
jgi:NAD(P)-dependent dehydrogenase (short-subunit alcohol dehydrogenase family)